MLVFWLLPSRQWRELSQRSRGAISNNSWQGPAPPTLDAVTLKLKRSASDNGPRRYVFGKRPQHNVIWLGGLFWNSPGLSPKQNKCPFLRLSHKNFFSLFITAACGQGRRGLTKGSFSETAPTTCTVNDCRSCWGPKSRWACHVRIHTPSASRISVTVKGLSQQYTIRSSNSSFLTEILYQQSCAQFALLQLPSCARCTWLLALHLKGWTTASPLTNQW